MCFVLCCYVIRISGLEGLVTTKAQTIVLEIGPKCGLSTLGQKFEDFGKKNDFFYKS